MNDSLTKLVTIRYADSFLDYEMSFPMIHSGSLALSRLEIHSSILILSSIMIHASSLVLSPTKVHSPLLVLSGLVVHSMLVLLSLILIHSSKLILSESMIHSGSLILSKGVIHSSFLALSPGMVKVAEGSCVHVPNVQSHKASAAAHHSVLRVLYGASETGIVSQHIASTWNRYEQGQA